MIVIKKNPQYFFDICVLSNLLNRPQIIVHLMYLRLLISQMIPTYFGKECKDYTCKDVMIPADSTEHLNYYSARWINLHIYISL